MKVGEKTEVIEMPWPFPIINRLMNFIGKNSIKNHLVIDGKKGLPKYIGKYEIELINPPLNWLETIYNIKTSYDTVMEFAAYTHSLRVCVFRINVPKGTIIYFRSTGGNGPSMNIHAGQLIEMASFTGATQIRLKGILYKTYNGKQAVRMTVRQTSPR